MKHFIFSGIIIACLASASISALTSEDNNSTQLLEIPTQSKDSLTNIQDTPNNDHAIKASEQMHDALTEVYEYEDASIKILKYFGIPLVAGMTTAFACLITIIND